MATIPIMERVFDSAEAAAIAALESIEDMTSETGGVIYQDVDGKFYYSDPQGQGNKGTLDLRVNIPKKAKVVALYHTHPGGDKAGSRFSANDVDIADNMKVLSYIRSHADGTIRRYQPGVTKTEKDAMSRRMRNRTSIGDLVKEVRLPPQKGQTLAKVN